MLIKIDIQGDKTSMGEREITINFKDYICFSVIKWKTFVIFLVIFTLLCGAFGFLYKSKSIGDYEQAIQKYNEELVAYNRKNTYLNLVCEQEKKIFDDATEYKEDSKLMNMDVSNVTVDIVVFRVKELEAETKDAETEENVEEAQESFEQFGNKEDNKKVYYALDTIENSLFTYVDWTSLEKKVNLDQDMIKQLVEVATNYDEYYVVVATRWEDKEGADAIMKAILTAFDNNVDKIAGLENYEVEKEDIFTCVVDEEAVFITAQNSFNNFYEGIEKTVEADAKDLENLVEPVEPTEADYGKSEVIKSAIKFAILGAMLGLFLAFIYLYESFTRKGIIFSVDEYERISEHMLLADLTAKDTDIEHERLAINLSKVADKKKVIFAINASKDELTDKSKEAVNNAVTYMKKKCPNIDVVVTKDYVSDNDSLKSLADADAVVAVYTLRDTTLTDIVRQDLLLKQVDKQVLGCVVV